MEQAKIWQKTVGNCRFIGDFDKLDMIGQGTYGTVFIAKDKTKQNNDNQIVAIKKMKVLDVQQGFPVTSLRQIKTLKMLKHPNIVELKQVVVGKKKDSVFLVFQFCQIDLSKLMDQMMIDKNSFYQSQIKCLFLQMAKGISYAHKKYIIHRDLKLTNILLNKQGIVKIADFGLARQFQKPFKPLTGRVVTLWYRAPQLLVRNKHYATSIDVWSAGCILAQLLQGGNPIFKGQNEVSQFQTICQLLGYPTKQDWPQFFTQTKKQVLKQLQKCSVYRKNTIKNVFKQYSQNCIDLLTKMLTWSPNKRISMESVLYHPYFYENPKVCFPDQIKVLSKLQFYGKKSAQELNKKRVKI